MIKIKTLVTKIAVAMSILALTACGSKESVKTAVADCVFPDSPSEAAPNWVCDEPVEGVSVSAVGSAEKSAAGHSFMKNMAATDARVQLAQQLNVHVQNMVKQYAETTGAASTETVDKVNTLVTKQITNETLAGSKIYKSRTSSNGTLYVLLGMDTSTAAITTQNIIKTSMNNEHAVWQQFKAHKGQEELAAGIAAQQDY